MEGKKKSPPPDRNPKTPKLKLPPGACDCHFHILGPQTRFPLKPNREMEFEDCTYDDLVAMQDTVGLSRGLIVQSFQHGHSYEYLLNALCSDPNRWRGIAGPAPDITDGEIEILSEAGVVGARYAAYVSPDLDVKLIQRLAEFGWQAHYIVNGEKAISAGASRFWRRPGISCSTTWRIRR